MEIVKWFLDFIATFLMGGFFFGVFCIKEADEDYINTFFAGTWFISTIIIVLITAIIHILLIIQEII